MRSLRVPRTAALLSLALAAPFATNTTPAMAQDPTEEPAAADEPAARDEDREFRFDFGLFGGGHFFAADHGLGRVVGDPEELSPKHSGVFGGRLGLHFNRWLTLEAEASAAPTKTRDGATNMWVVAYRGAFLLHLSKNYVFRPFLTAGYGALNSVVNDESVVPNDLDGFLHAGLGFKVGFSEQVGLRLEGRIMAPPSFASDIAPVGDETGYGGPDFEVLGGLYIAFGEVAKATTIVKKEVTVVPPAAPPPPSDPDGDGIAGANGKCPNVAEDKDGFEDEDGCPEADNDKDNIPDQQDKCPLKPETVNGIDDDDGCPEEDTDGDGIIGSRDKCPDQPETKNNYQDEDGCPDEIPVAVKKFTGVIEGINFKTNSAEILPGSFGLLDRALKVLQEYPDVNLEIAGHTDSRGSADYNRDLSQRRADSVRTYFTSRGIDAKRLTTIGYGEDKPIADNKSESGRARNRRTEFRLINPGER